MNDLPFPNRVVLAVVACLLVIFPHGIVQRLHAQSASSMHIMRPDARWSVPAAAPPPAALQDTNLTVRVIRGDNAVNNISTRTAQEPIIEVRDSDLNPIEGAAVTFFLPQSGPGATFGGGATILGTETDDTGRAVGAELTPNDLVGEFDIQIQVTYEQRTVTTTISQRNTLTGTLEGGGGSSTAFVILGIVGAAAAGVGLALARSSGGGGGGSTPPPTSDPIRITPGTPTVGAPTP